MRHLPLSTISFPPAMTLNTRKSSSPVVMLISALRPGARPPISSSRWKALAALRETICITVGKSTPAFSALGAPYFEQAQLVLVCRKLYADDLRPEKFTDQSLDGRWYPEHDYHRMYAGEVVQVLKK